jgi:hypothetical protein
MELTNPRILPGVHSPEIHATVRACRLMPPRVPAAMTASRAAA